MNHQYEAFIHDTQGAVVLKNGRPLPLCTDIANHSPTGFAWGYGGSGPAQLALALMVSEYGEDLSQHPVHYQRLKEVLIAAMPQDVDFKLSSEEIRNCVNVIANNTGASLSP